MRARADLYCCVSNWLEIGVNEGGKRIVLGDLQRDETSFETVFEEYPFFPLGPLNIVGQCVDLSLLTVRDGGVKVEQRSDCNASADWQRRHRGWLTEFGGLGLRGGGHECTG